MKAKNPFKVLGLDSDILRGLDYETTQTLVSRHYKNLQLIFHPDSRPHGSEKRSKELNEAYGELSNGDRDMFDFYLQDFLRKKVSKDRESELEIEVGKSAEEVARQCEQFVEFFKSRAGFDEGYNVFNIAPCRIKIYDHGLAMNLPIHMTIGQKNSERLFSYLNVRKDGSVVTRTNRGSVVSPGKMLVGCIDEETVRDNNGMKVILQRIQDIWTPGDERLRKALGSDRKRMGNHEVRDYSFKISPAVFQPILRLLTPRVNKNYALFSINREDGEVYFRFEGNIMEIHKK